MNELIITLESVNPVVLWGPNNEYYDLIKRSFSKLKIVTRGNEVKVLGDEKELLLFNEKLGAIIQHLEKYQNLSTNDVDSILGSTSAGQKNEGQTAEEAASNSEVIVFGPNGIMVKARTANQRKMVASINKNDVLFAIGPAGTGKTYTAVALAVRALKNKEIKRIILTRPAVEAGENLGFLPGDLKEKLDPYMQPLYDALREMIPFEKLKEYMETGVIEIAPLAFMRGRTLNNAFVILDEAQNANQTQLRMFLTRMGKSAKFMVTGDVTQIDLPKKSVSGLLPATKILKGIKEVSIIHLDGSDIVRHPLVGKIITAYESAENQ